MLTSYDKKILADSVCNILNVIFAEYFCSRGPDYNMTVEYGKHPVSKSGTIEKIRLKNLKENSVIWEADFTRFKTISEFTFTTKDFEDFCAFHTKNEVN